MFVIDENVSEIEVLRLRKAGIAVRLIGSDVGRTGDDDTQIIPALLRLKKPVFFTQDEDFFQYRLLHEHYGLVWLNVRPNTVADFTREFLRHPEFDKQAKRLGTVARVRVSGISFWRGRERRLKRVSW